MTRTTERYLLAGGLAVVGVLLTGLLALAGEWRSAGAGVLIVAIYVFAVISDTSGE